MKQKNRISLNIIKIFLFIVITTIFLQAADDTTNFIPKNDGWKNLTLREKIGQTMVIVSGYYQHKNFEGKDLAAFFDQYPVGGVFLPDWYYYYNAPKDSTLEFYIKESIKDYAANSKFPLFFMEDFERGLGLQYPEFYTQMPVEMTIGAARSEELAFQYGKSIAMEARDLGINWLLHPVADLNMNPLHSLVLERSVSDDPDIALPILRKQIDGMRSQGIICTVKHFPGDGATIRDQHIMTAQNPLKWNEWKQTYGRVFQELIDYNVPAIMVGHLTFPAYQKEKYHGNFLPASLSSELIGQLLKKEMNFKGVVISDALNMGGAAGYYPNELETSIASFAAGVDLILWPSLAFMDTLEARILRNEIPMERLDDAVQRIWKVKERFGLLNKPASLFNELTTEDKEFVNHTAAEVAENAVTLVRGEQGYLPLDPKKSPRILLVNVSHTDKTELFIPTKNMLEKRGFEVTLRYNLGYRNWNWRMDSLTHFDKIIACFENKYFDPVGIPFLKGIEAESAWTFNMLPKEKMICISYSNPYYLKFYFQHIPVLINAYSCDIYMQEAVLKALTGEIPFKGRSPVQLDPEILR
jgi:beta-N-acetylhexosaminidase